MDKSAREQYKSLRKIKGLLTFSSRVSLIGLHLLAAVWFGHYLYILLTVNQTDTQRIGTVIVGLVGMGAFAMAGFILYLLLRSMAEIIELLFDTRDEAVRTKEVVEDQLLPIMFGIERQAGMPEAERAKRWGQREKQEAEDSVGHAHGAVRDALQREWWRQAEKLAEDLRRKFPDSDEAKGIDKEIVRAKAKRKAMLFDQAEAAGQRNDWDALGRVRDRLCAFAGDDLLPALDNDMATRLLRVRAQMERDGKKREAGRLVVHLSKAFGHTRAVRQALSPTEGS
jgi:hypothetical protein